MWCCNPVERDRITLELMGVTLPSHRLIVRFPQSNPGIKRVRHTGSSPQSPMAGWQPCLGRATGAAAKILSFASGSEFGSQPSRLWAQTCTTTPILMARELTDAS